jgi:dGTPase
MMRWSQLLYPQRLGKTVTEDLSLARTPFQRDFDRLIFSAAFRRLKDKTQVFSLSQNDYVRTRLIHSLEVASVGRSLGRIVGERIETGLDYVTAADIGDITAAACIAHDIGNPPFGHSGENAIRAGFQAWQKRQQNLSLTAAQRADLERFEGNAQGFRTIARLEIPHRPGSLQLTCPTIAAFAKYPRESLLAVDGMVEDQGKYGFFQADRELFVEVAESVGLIPSGGSALAWCRHPLTYLVEAADDICYSVVDIEDGYQMGYLSFGEVVELLNPIAKLDLTATVAAPAEQVIHLRAKAIDVLVKEAAGNFLMCEAEMLCGEFEGDLLALSRDREAIANIHERARLTIFQHPSVVGVQVAGYEVLSKLFNEFADALRQPNNPKSQLVLQMLPNHILDTDSYQQLLQVTDLIAGMTDSYATRLFQQFSGISLL